MRDALADQSVPVRGFLCFVDADWPLFGGQFTTRHVTVLWPKRLVAHITEPGHLTDDATAAIDERLSKAFPVA